MRKSLKDKFPSWVDSNKYCDLCLTDDFDSLISCALLNKHKGYKIKYFYDFDRFYSTGKRNHEVIGVDLSLVDGACWDNHVTLLSKNDKVNPYSANLNSVKSINRNNYCKKYSMSTALTILSYYDIPLPESEEGKMILLSVDSGFLGWYSKKFHEVHKYWLKMMELKELIPILEKYTIDDFNTLINKYNLKQKIYIENNKLKTNVGLVELQGFFNLDLVLPNDDFKLIKTFNRGRCNLLNTAQKKKENLFSCALTYRDTLNYSY